MHDPNMTSMSDPRYSGANSFFPVFPQTGPAFAPFAYSSLPSHPPPTRFAFPQQSGWFPQSTKGKGGSARKKHAKKQDSNLPSLHQLQAENKDKTKKHYRGQGGKRPHWSVPRAPEHSTKYLFPTPDASQTSPAPQGFHSVTPAASFASAEKGYWRNGLGNIDKEAAEIGAAAGIDMFGSNAGLITRADGGEMLSEHNADDSLFDEEDPYGFELHVEEESDPAAGRLPASVRQRLDEQAAYICQLEETNLKLQEKIYLLEQHVKELQANGVSQPVNVQEDAMAQSSGSAGAQQVEEDDVRSHSEASASHASAES